MIRINKRLLLSVLVFPAIFFCSCGSEPEKNTNDNASVSDSGDAGEKKISQEIKNGKYYFSGMINHKYSIYMKFDYYEGKITGAYYYNSQKKELDLFGDMKDGKLELDEKVNEKITGHFSGIIYGMDSVSGIWKSPKGKELEFALYKSGEYDYSTNLSEPENKRWRTEEVQAFAKNFKEVNLPFDYDNYNTNMENDIEMMTDEDVRKFIDENYKVEDDWVMNFYYYGNVFYTPKYVGLVYVDHYIPGAFGINNVNVVLMTISHEGELIDSEYLGCNCNDTNMGANDYYSNDDTFSFSSSSIKVHTTAIYGTLIEEEGKESFEDRSEETRTIKIDAEGNIESGK